MIKIINKYKIVIILYIILASFFIYYINTYIEKDYLAIEDYDGIKINVIETKKHNRGFLIINSKYTITCNHFLINRNVINNYKYKKCICDLETPYEISHIYNSDTLIIYKDNLKLFYLKQKTFY
jgi:hypothetical protein